MVFTTAITRVSFNRVDNTVLNTLNNTSMVGFAVLRARTSLVIPIEKDNHAGGRFNIVFGPLATIKTYQKRPIYWLFDSGKQNGFKALCYMHRWNADTTGNMRVEYLHRMQRVYEKEIIRMQEIIDNSRDNKEISNATKRKEKLQKQIKETKDYDAKVAHLALSRIDIDLDDGVKVNYEKVQTASDGKKMQILAKI